MSGLAEDLQPYFAMDMYYDVIIGHSLGGTVALSLLPFLPKEKEITVILVDPPIKVPDERLPTDKIWFLNEVTSAKTVEELMAQYPTWSRTNCLLRMLALSMCDSTAVKSIIEVHSQLWRIENIVDQLCLCDNQYNTPWSFSGLFNNIPSNVEITVLVADPKLTNVCHLDHIPRGIERLNARGLTGVGHNIPFDRPEAIMNAIPLPRAEV